jgi:hypothetical protein
LLPQQYGSKYFSNLADEIKRFRQTSASASMPQPTHEESFSGVGWSLLAFQSPGMRAARPELVV